MFGKVFPQGALSRFIFVSILEQQYFSWRFYPALTRWGFALPVYSFAFSDSS